jgi:branched-subunit amino acid transport protein
MRLLSLFSLRQSCAIITPITRHDFLVLRQKSRLRAIFSAIYGFLLPFRHIHAIFAP